jgi:cysteine dioxygenase
MMLATTLSSDLRTVLSSIESRSQPFEINEVRTLLSTLAACSDELTLFADFDARTYKRNRIFRNDAVDILLLCWRSTQRTPIHDHAGSICGVYVLQGEATEIAFKPSGIGLLIPGESKSLRSGDITVSIDSDAHMVGNFTTPEQDLVTLHCYSPPLTSMRVFHEKETFFADYDAITTRASTSEIYRVET